jgi:hypothetical protein
VKSIPDQPRRVAWSEHHEPVVRRDEVTSAAFRSCAPLFDSESARSWRALTGLSAFRGSSIRPPISLSRRYLATLLLPDRIRNVDARTAAKKIEARNDGAFDKNQLVVVSRLLTCVLARRQKDAL